MPIQQTCTQVLWPISNLATHWICGLSSPSSTNLKIYPVFHMSFLKKKIGDTASFNPTLPPIDFIDFLNWQPEEILDRRIKKKKKLNEVVTKWLIKRARVANRICYLEGNQQHTCPLSSGRWGVVGT